MSNEELSGLIEAVGLRRDRAAFTTLFRYIAPRFKAFAMSKGCAHAEAEELVQEAMIAIWRRASTFDRSKSAASTWMFTIVRNKRIDRLRRERYPTAEFDEAVQQPADLPDPGQSMDAARAGESVRDALRTLPAEQLLVLEKAFFEDKSHSAIADELGIPLGTVKSRIRLALTRLRGESMEAFA